MNECWDQFDEIVCIHHAKDRHRLAGIRAEFDRVGILRRDNFRFHVTTRGCFDMEALKAMRGDAYDIRLTPAQINCCLAHIHVIRAALDAGADRLLVLEDDIRFLKDADRARRIVGAWDGKFDVCLFDKFDWMPAETDRSAKGGFVPFQRGIRGGSCYALTRAGMEAMLEAHDNFLHIRHVLLMNDLLYDYLSCTRAYAPTNACVQRDFSGSMNQVVYKTRDADVYTRNGVDLTLYAEA